MQPGVHVEARDRRSCATGTAAAGTAAWAAAAGTTATGTACSTSACLRLSKVRRPNAPAASQGLAHAPFRLCLRPTLNLTLHQPEPSIHMIRVNNCGPRRRGRTSAAGNRRARR